MSLVSSGTDIPSVYKIPNMPHMRAFRQQKNWRPDRLNPDISPLEDATSLATERRGYIESDPG